MNKKKIIIGILGIQGSREEHEKMLQKIGCDFIRIKNAEDGLTVQKTLNIIPLSNLLILEILFDKVGDKIGTDDSARGDGSDSKPLPDLLHRRG